MKGAVRLRSQRYVLAFLAVAVFSHRASSVSAQDLSVIGTPEQTNERIRTLGTAAKSGPHEYTIGNGDLLSISVFDVPELSRDVRVGQTGTIGIPLVPTRLHVAGLTETQAEQLIADVLQANGLVSHPEVGVMVKEHKSKPITIVGAVMHPMVYEADHTVTLLEALAVAGGISNDAGDIIIVTRGHAPAFTMVPVAEPADSSAPGAGAPAETPAPDSPGVSGKDTQTSLNPPTFPSATEAQTRTPSSAADLGNASGTAPTPTSVITVNLNELIEKGDIKDNITLHAGDIVTVPHAGIVYVLGAVNRPGGFVLTNDRREMKTMKVLALAGGWTRIAKLDHAVIIRTDDQGKQTETEIDLKKVIGQKTEDVQLRASDILYIPDNRAKEYMLQAIQLSLAMATSIAIYRIGNY